MKKTPIFLLLAAVVFTAPAFGQSPVNTASSSATEPQAEVPTIASVVDRQISSIEKQIVDAAEAMPEAKFNFSPEMLNIPGADYKGVRTFAVQIKHIAASNYALWAPLTGDKIPDDFRGGDGPATVKSKADIIKFLKDSFAMGHKAAATLTAQNMAQLVDHPKWTRLHLATFTVEHAFDHYGQMVEYLRMNGIVPPASAPKAQAEKESSTSPQPQPPAPRVVDVTSSDGTLLKATYFAAVKPGPGVLLLHQINRTRNSWDGVAAKLAAAGINTLTLDLRGLGESGGMSYEKFTGAEVGKEGQRASEDIDAALQYLSSQPGVTRDTIGIGGAGGLGVNHAAKAAHRHAAAIKSLALLSGEAVLPELRFLRQAWQLPGLYVVADDDEYPPTQEAMELLYVTSSSPSKKFVHYSAAHDAPWLWYEPFDIGRVPAGGGHGTDMFRSHPELPGIIVDWFVTTLIRTPGHAPADTLAAASILNQIEQPGGVAQVAQQLAEARRTDPNAQLFPEITVSILAQDHMRVGDPKTALEIFKLILQAYSDSADANDNLADAYLANGQRDLARQHAGKALALLDSHAAPASSWSDTEPQRGEIRRDAQKILDKLKGAQQ